MVARRADRKCINVKDLIVRMMDGIGGATIFAGRIGSWRRSLTQGGFSDLIRRTWITFV
jgi:hypothetical protein